MGKSSKGGVFGHKYWAGIHFTLCRGPIDGILEIWYGDKLAWKAENPLVPEMDKEIVVNAENLFGGNQTEGGISGPIDLMNGYPDQQKNSYLVSKIASHLLPAYRGIVSMVAKQVYWGNSRYPKPMKVLVSRTSTRCSFDTQRGEKYHYLSAIGMDMNPAYILMEMLTSDWGRGLPESMLGDSWVFVSTELLDERLGLSFLFTKETPVDEMIKEVLRHIDGVIYEDDITGLIEIKLIRGDYDQNTIPVAKCGVIGEIDNSDLMHIEKTAVAELVNQVTVSFFNRSSRNKSSVSVQDAAAIGMTGRIVSQTLEYPGISNDEVALKIAERDLSRVARQYSRGTIKLNREFAGIRPGDVFKLLAPNDGVGSMVCRVIKRSESDFISGEITVDFIEDVFGKVWTTYAPIPPSGWVSPIGAPQNFKATHAFEVPYVMAVAGGGEAEANQIGIDYGLYAFAGAEPYSGAHMSYNMWTFHSGGSIPLPDQSKATSQYFTPVAVVSHDTKVDDKKILTSGIDSPDGITEGTLCLAKVNDNDVHEELMAITSVDPDGTLHVKRGVGDSVPKPIPAGSVIFFIGIDAGISMTLRANGERVGGYGAPVNLAGVYEGPFTYEYVNIEGRMARPYPPAAVRYNGEFDPVAISGELRIEWAHRNRKDQADQLIDWYDTSNYWLEMGTAYTISIRNENGGVITLDSYTENSYTLLESDELSELNKYEDGPTDIFEIVGGAQMIPKQRLNGHLDISIHTFNGDGTSVESIQRPVFRSGWGYSWNLPNGE